MDEQKNLCQCYDEEEAYGFEELILSCESEEDRLALEESLLAD